MKPLHMMCLVLVSVTMTASPASGRHRFPGFPRKLTDRIVSIAVKRDPELDMNATEIISSYGYPVEDNYVTTDDGYILNVIRIPHGRDNRHFTGPKPVVLIQHGFTGSCHDYLGNPPNQSLAYILADAGADVWLANSRGTLYSKAHIHLHPNQFEFWQFSWDQMAKYDLPAMITHIKRTAGVDQIYYVGHSQGTTIGFAGFGEDQELGASIKHFIALAPIAAMGHTKSPLRVISPLSKKFKWVLNVLGDGEFGKSSKVSRIIGGSLCEDWGAYLCESFQFLFNGPDSFKSMNMSRVPIIIAHGGAGSTSVNDVIHWAQAITTKRFQRFDYGSVAANIEHYGQPTPPLYDVRKVEVPVTVFRGGRDILADPEDVSLLLPKIPNLSHDFNVPYYNHIDFLYAMDSPQVVYEHILQVIFS